MEFATRRKKHSKFCLATLIVFGASTILSGCSRSSAPQARDTTAESHRATERVGIGDGRDGRAEEFAARVMKVVDGDTIKMLDRDFQSVLIQLNGVDAPELPQEFGEQARDALAKRLEDKVVRVVVAERDELNRIAGEVFDGNESINVWVIEQGHGWYNHKYDTDEAKSLAETTAREAGRGLWSAENPVPPWVWKNPPDDGRLYVQGNGKKYHRGNCQTLDGRRKPISLADALKNHQPCQRCKPPTE